METIGRLATARDDSAMNTPLLIALSVTGAVGISLLFVGILMVLLAAFGNRHYYFGSLFFLLFIVPMVLGRAHPTAGFVMVLLIPLTTIYCYRHRQVTHYANKLLLPGLIISLATALTGWIFVFQPTM